MTECLDFEAFADDEEKIYHIMFETGSRFVAPPFEPLSYTLLHASDAGSPADDGISDSARFFPSQDLGHRTRL